MYTYLYNNLYIYIGMNISWPPRRERTTPCVEDVISTPVSVKTGNTHHANLNEDIWLEFPTTVHIPLVPLNDRNNFDYYIIIDHY